MKILLSIITLCLVVLVAGCVDTIDTKQSSPSGTLESFRTALGNGIYDSCYSLMSNDYKETYTYPQFLDEIKNTQIKYRKYSYAGIVDSENVQTNTTFLKIEYSYKLGVEETLRSLFRGPPADSEKIEFVNESTGWKFKYFPTKLVLATQKADKYK